jgi:hypothetical protein
MNQEIIDLTSSEDEETHYEMETYYENQQFEMESYNRNKQFEMNQLKLYESPSFENITRKINIINEKLYFFNESIEVLQQKYQDYHPIVILDKNFRLLFANTKYFEIAKIRYGKTPNEMLYINIRKLTQQNDNNSMTTKILSSKVSNLILSNESDFIYEFEKKNDQNGNMLSVTISASKIKNVFENVLYEFKIFIKPLNYE